MLSIVLEYILLEKMLKILSINRKGSRGDNFKIDIRRRSFRERMLATTGKPFSELDNCKSRPIHLSIKIKVENRLE